MAHPTPSLGELYQSGRLAEFFSRTPRNLPDFLSAPRELDRPALAKALEAYSHSANLLGPAPAFLKPAQERLRAQLKRLSHPQARVVVAGQQARLLGGPAYSVHKAADAALLSRQLDREDAPVLPVFWIASQDHNSAEVASTHLLDLRERAFHPSLNLPEGVPVGRILWREAWTEELRALIHAFDALAPHKAWVLERLEYAWQGQSYADVFARLMFSLLGESGLLLLDPLHPALAALAIPALERELLDPLSGPQRIEEAAARLEQRGFKAQLRRPEGATNLFLEGEDGQRRLLRYAGGRFFAGDDYSREALLALLRRDPSRITPAAGLRPAVQDTLLPTVAFVVGPGELAYGAQLRGVYELCGVPQPVLWPRLSVTWLEPNVARLLRQYGLSAAEFQRGPEQALGAALARERQLSALSERHLDALSEQFQALTRDLSALDPTLQRSVSRTEDYALSRLERHRQQAIRALARAEDKRSGQLGRLKLHLLPHEHPQEREMNFLTYLLKHGRLPLNMLLSLPAGTRAELEIP